MNVSHCGGPALTLSLLLLLTLWLMCWLGGALAGGDNNGGDTSRSRKKCEGQKTLDACLKQLPPILDQAEMIGIPSTKKDVEASCSAFKTGMGCIDEYSKACLKPHDRKVLEDHVAGARYTFRFLCDDPGFQSEYLKYKTCYRGVSRDWDACASRFVQLVREEMNRRNATETSRLMELCCAKHGFLRCVYAASRYKCRKEEALFLKKIAETLSDTRVYSPHCNNVDTKLCSHGTIQRTPPVLMMLTATFFSLFTYILSCC